MKDTSLQIASQQQEANFPRFLPFKKLYEFSQGGSSKLQKTLTAQEPNTAVQAAEETGAW